MTAWKAADGTAAGPSPEHLLARAYFLALRVTGRPELAEEAAQDAWVRLLREPAPRSGGPDAAVRLLRLAREAALDLARSEGARARRERIYAMETAGRRGNAGGPGGRAEARELGAAARAALARLPMELRLAVSLCCEQELSQAAAGQVLSMPQREVSRAVEAGLARLRHELGASGFGAAAPTALAASLGRMGLPPAPAGLVAAAAEASAGREAGAVGGAASATAKEGGLVMKVLAGVVLAGALAGIMGGLIGSRRRLPAAPVAAGKPTGEHWAFVNSAGRLDGPRCEAMGVMGVADVDDAGNLYGGGRVVRVDGMVETIWGDNFSNASPTALEEGPASLLSVRGVRGNGWSSQGFLAVQGRPLDGGDKGAIFVPASNPNAIYKVWKDKGKKDRWWFKRVAGGGSAALPANGKSVPAIAVGLPGYNMFRGHDGKLYVRAGGWNPSLFRYDDVQGDLTCILSPEDYRDKLDKNKHGSPAGAETVLVGADGAIYLGCSLGEGARPIYRISADRRKFDKIVHGRGLNTGWDGPALKSGYFDGPILAEYFPPDSLFMTAVDDSQLRRYKDGRVSTLCADGEWREFPNKGKCGSWLPMYGYKGKDADSAIIGRRFVLWNNHVYMLYFNGLGSHAIVRFGPYDFNKPTVGPLVEGR